MILGIDHLVIAVADPDGAADEVARALGLVPGGGGRHEQLGTFNRLIWLGDSFLELIGVFDPVLAAASWIGAPAERALEAGGGLATWAVATDDIDGDIARLRSTATDLSAIRSTASAAAPTGRSSDGDSPRRGRSARPGRRS